MSAKKQRRSMEDDPDAMGFVFGQSVPEPVEQDETETEQELVTEEQPEPPKPAKKPRSQAKQPAKPNPPKGDFMSQLMNKAEAKERTVRITVDLPDSLHQKLSNLSGRTRMTKADIIRGLLNEALNAVDE